MQYALWQTCLCLVYGSDNLEGQARFDQRLLIISEHSCLCQGRYAVECVCLFACLQNN